MYNYKFKLFTISLIAVSLVQFVKNVDIPMFFGYDWEFVGWSRLLTYGNAIALLSFVMFVAALYYIRQLSHWLKCLPDGLTTTIKEVQDRSLDYINTLTIIVTLFSVIIVPIVSLRDFFCVYAVDCR